MPDMIDAGRATGAASPYPEAHLPHTGLRLRVTLRRSAVGLSWSLALALSGAAHSQTPFPSKPIRVIVASAPGGAMDAIGRVVAMKLGDAVGQTAIVDNRGGANWRARSGGHREVTARWPHHHARRQRQPRHRPLVEQEAGLRAVAGTLLPSR